MLYIACDLGRKEIVQILLFGMANPDLGIETSSDTPLMIASQKGHFDIVKLLIHHKCDIFKTNKNGMNALSFACLSKQNQYNIAKFIYYSAIESRKSNKTNKFLSDKDFDKKIRIFVNQKTVKNGETPYMIARRVGNKRAAQFLFDIHHVQHAH